MRNYVGPRRSPAALALVLCLLASAFLLACATKPAAAPAAPAAAAAAAPAAEPAPAADAVSASTEWEEPAAAEATSTEATTAEAAPAADAVSASTAAADATSSASAEVQVPANFVFYTPGMLNPSDPKADIEAAGFTASDTFNAHFMYVSDDLTGAKILKLNTLDGVNDSFKIPLAGTEKRITLIFKAKGGLASGAAAGGDTPYGIFWAQWQRGGYQAVLRHNSSNQIKGSSGQTGLNPENIVSEWRDYRLVFEVAADGMAMTATAFVDGTQRHQTAAFVKASGSGDYLAFGDNDGSTNALGRYPYFILVKDEDVSGKTLAELGALVAWDLVANPKISIDPDPVRK